MILDDIVLKRKEQLKREMADTSLLCMKEKALSCLSPHPSFMDALATDEMSVICEVKKASPSKGVIEPNFMPVEQAKAYEKAGASAISCLTEEHFFMGNSKYLADISKNVSIPILRKDFVIDEYQIYEARAIGASAILLICAILDLDTLKRFIKLANELTLDCLVEVHNEQELEMAQLSGTEIIGINNRNLKTFDVSLDITKNLSEKLPSDKIIVSESGIKTNDDIKRLESYGADAVLIGETLMKSNEVKTTLTKLMDGL